MLIAEVAKRASGVLRDKDVDLLANRMPHLPETGGCFPRHSKSQSLFRRSGTLWRMTLQTQRLGFPRACSGADRLDCDIALLPCSGWSCIRTLRTIRRLDSHSAQA